MTQSLRREVVQKFYPLLLGHYYLQQDGKYTDEQIAHAKEFAATLADAALEVSAIQRRAEVVLSENDIQEVNAKVDYIIAQNDATKAWQGRELIRADLLHYADWYNLTTGQVMTKRATKAWWKALSDWKEESLTIEDLQEAYAARSKWRTVADPNELTKDAAAIHALPEGTAQKPKSLEDMGWK